MDANTYLNVHVELEPHNQDLTNMLINRPAPTWGAFVISNRLDKKILDEMKNAGAWYWSESELEDMDMFHSEPGWRYSLEALHILIRHGFTLNLRGQIVSTLEELDYLFSDQGKMEYRARLDLQHEDEAREIKHEKDAQVAKWNVQDKWEEQHLAGLLHISSHPERATWRKIESPFEYSTWFVAEIDGVTIYRCHAGVQSTYYVTEELAREAVENYWNWLVNQIYNGNEARAAWNILTHVTVYRECYFGSDSELLLEMHGEEFFAGRARIHVPKVNNRVNGGSEYLDRKSVV